MKMVKITALLFFLVFLLLSVSSCDIVKVKLKESIVSVSEDAAEANMGDKDESGSKNGIEEDSKTTGKAGEAAGEETSNAGINEYSEFAVAYFEVTSSEKSKHFEHRVGNIYSVNPDGTEKKLIYSDIDNKFDLGPVYSVSPDGTKIIGMLNEGGRGLYSALVVINVTDGSLKKLVEFDFSENEESGEVELGIYGEPIWSNDSKKIAFEMVFNPYTDPFSGSLRDVGVQVIDIESGHMQEAEVDLGGASIRSTTFLCPVLFSEDDKYIFAVSHPYYEKTEEGEVTGYYTYNDTLYSISLTGGEPVRILGQEDFGSQGPEIIQSFDNFGLFRSEDKIIFQVLGDFEEDGDIWSCNYDGSEPVRLTSDSSLREQQPDVFDAAEPDKSIVAYVGSGRYGTISSGIPSGDIYIIQKGSSGPNLKITDYNNLQASTPVISPDGNFVAFLYSKYDSNFTYVEENTVRIYNLTDGTAAESAEGTGGSYGFILSISGWIKF